MERLLHNTAAVTRPGLVRRIANMILLTRQRRRLADLSDHILNDIGISRDEARREADRPAWDVPSHWRA